MEAIPGEVLIYDDEVVDRMPDDSGPEASTPVVEPAKRQSHEKNDDEADNTVAMQ